MATRKIKCKQHPGLKRSGRLKKGYYYDKNGTIKKVSIKKSSRKKAK